PARPPLSTEKFRGRFSTLLENLPHLRASRYGEATDRVHFRRPRLALPRYARRTRSEPMKLQAIAGMVVLICIAASAPERGGAAADDAATVAALDTEYQAAVKRNDADTMDRILADDFVLVTGRGQVFTKADLLRAAREKSTTYEHQEDTEQKVRLWGE